MREMTATPFKLAGLVVVGLLVWGGTSLLSPAPDRLDTVTYRKLVRQVADTFQENASSRGITVARVDIDGSNPACVAGVTRHLRQVLKVDPTAKQTLQVRCDSIDGQRSVTATYVSAAPGFTMDPIIQSRRVPDFTTLLPPLFGILFALIFRKVLLALFGAILFGSFLYTQNVWDTVQHTTVDVLGGALDDEWNLYILAFTALLVGMIHISIRMGGMQGIVQALSRIAKGRRSAQTATGVMGCVVFFDDYANTVVVGSSVRPLTDRFRISREKLAYLVDSTAAPVAGIAIISTWIGFEIGQFNDQIQQDPYLASIASNGYELFFQILPYRFYCLFALALVFLVALTGRDFGPMLKAERRALMTGQLRRRASDQDAQENRRKDTVIREGAPPRWINGILPILVVVFGMVAGMLIVGGDMMADDPDRGMFGFVRDAFIAAKDETVAILFWASLAGAVVALLLALTQRILPLADAAWSFFNGLWAIAPVIAILILAIGLRTITDDLGTDLFLVALVGDVPIEILPVIIFGLAAVTAFSTGTSWGTMGILLPVAVPLLTTLAQTQPESGALIVLLGAAAVLDGAIFGDHCSVISDTTIMSSLSSGCDHIDHVRTQLPYALLAMAMAALVGYLMLPLVDVPVLVAYAIGIFLMFAWLRLRGQDPAAGLEL
ncbi:MAG: Na+/H+ antiporter NhaC [Myxococcota bacterium]|jgi:Na+/H+ antiporter NhaC